MYHFYQMVSILQALTLHDAVALICSHRSFPRLPRSLCRRLTRLARSKWPRDVRLFAVGALDIRRDRREVAHPRVQRAKLGVGLLELRVEEPHPLKGVVHDQVRERQRRSPRDPLLAAKERFQPTEVGADPPSDLLRALCGLQVPP